MLTTDTSEELRRRLLRDTEGEVAFGLPSRGRYATDASIYQVIPVGVLTPRSDRDVAVAIDIARDLKVPVLPRGAGTSQCGQTTGAALVIDYGHAKSAPGETLQAVGKHQYADPLVAPGLVDTPMAKGWEAAYELWNTKSPMRRPAKPEDIADVVAGFCASDYVTGEILIADGGLNLT